MLRKYFIPSGMIGLVLSLVVASLYYSTGPLYEKSSIGYDTENDYPVTLPGAKAVDDVEYSPPLGSFGNTFLSGSFGLFLIEPSGRIFGDLSCEHGPCFFAKQNGTSITFDDCRY